MTSFSMSPQEEQYVRGIDGYRRVALSIPSLSISLASFLLAFEIYYLQVYVPKPGFFVEDLIVMLPMFAGCLFLVCAAFALDWIVDSFSEAELRALNQMYSQTEGADHTELSRMARGFFTRLRLFSGAYAMFSACLALIFFLLLVAPTIFLKDGVSNSLARSGIVVGGGYLAILLAMKMMTSYIPKRLWTVLLGFAAVFLAGVVWSILTLLKIIGG